MKKSFVSVLIFFLAIGGISYGGTIIYVDVNNTGYEDGTQANPYNTIYEGLSVAISGDTVSVAAGTYSPTTDEAFPISMKNGVSLVGAGADVCTLDAEGPNRVIYCSGISDTETSIEGFTITNSSTSYGGGIYCYSSNPTITNNVITANSTRYYDGGGICCEYSSPAITNNVITGNSGYWGGGGIRCYSSSPTITNNTITANSAAGGGGILCIYYSNPTITNNVITGNSADEGGGISCGVSSPTITNNTITGNSSGNNGGGIYCEFSSNPTITNNVITANSAAFFGGGIGCLSSSPAITYNEVWGNTGGDYYRCGPGTGCISLDPMFVDLAGGDYHLQPGSPCIEAGDNNAPGLPEFDFDGNPRIMDGDGDGNAVVDMGVFEYQGVIEVYVDIKPGSCPNPLNVKSKGILTVAVLGTEDFDVDDIDPVTILLTREGFEDPGVAPIRLDYEDVATPFEGELYDCHDLNGDGYLDLTIKFETQELVETLELKEVTGQIIPLILTGNLNEEAGGTSITGSDCIKIR